MNAYSYIVRLHLADGTILYKVGKTNNTMRRFKEIQNYTYTTPIAWVEPIKVYTLGDENMAEVFESIMRRYFIGKYGIECHLKNDRFTGIAVTKQDLNTLNRKYRFVKIAVRLGLI